MEESTGRRPAITYAWRKAAEKILTEYPVTPAEVAAVIDWATADAFWQPIVTTMPKLYVKFDALLLKTRNARTTQIPTTSSRVRDALALADQLETEAAGPAEAPAPKEITA